MAGLDKGWLAAVNASAKAQGIDIHAEMAQQALEQSKQASEEDLEDMRARVEAIFTPTERQAAFLESTAFETLFGGAAGGGKSHALMGLALRRSVLPRHTSILFRETFRQINGADGLAQKSMQMYPHAGGIYNGSEHRWTFPTTGSQVYFAHLANRNAYLAQQGLAFQNIGFDELTHFSESDYLFLISRARSVVPGVTPIIRATANPGGPGHEWVLNRWRPWLDPEHPNPAKAGEVRWYLRRGDTEEEVPAGTKYARSRTFIPSLLTDNPYLMHDDEYMANLMSLPELEREQLLRGNWTIKISAGLFFQRGRFSVVGGVPMQERLVRVRYWDRAASEPSETYKDPDYTVGMMVG